MDQRAGQILFSSNDGHYLLRMEGDVRLTLCHLVEEQVKLMCADESLQSVAVDVGPALGIDSTTLGVLAKLALNIRRQHGFNVVVYSPNASITRLLKSMCLQDILELKETEAPKTYGEFCLVSTSDAMPLAKTTVVEAHQTLMDLSVENEARFKDLMKTLNAQ